MQSKLAVQLYTLREACKQDFPATLRRLKEMGWAGVQMAGYHDHDPQELARLIRELGLQTAGLHVSYARIVDELELLAQEAEWFRTKDLICPSIPVELRTEEGYREVRETLQRAAEAVKERGLRISYHNHAFEFDVQVDDRSALEYILEPQAGSLVLAELDVYWLKRGGRDIMSFIEPYENRMPIVHLKDMTKDERETFAEIGTGSIDFLPILRWGEQSGVEWYVVEQDQCDGDPLESVQTSLANLTRLIAQV
ncbi:MULTISPECIES: sugar phosphate isomerase/epimerase [unclassified Paenibacillus]|uniref:sugar phosphate isomerase/epimerase family protein n=1 Tax=unclassified Paenibacillus TaxID=185978 RepID=UPI0009312055|nr:MULTISPECIES: sugar phosphate isomerase/epimerase [unclassified Paenibacillus]